MHNSLEVNEYLVKAKAAMAVVAGSGFYFGTGATIYVYRVNPI